MRKTLLGTAVFVAAFFAGRSIASTWQSLVTQGDLLNPTSISAIENEPIELPALLTDIDAEFDPPIDYAKNLRVKLLQTGDFHSDEVPYHSGEKWLGLFRVKGSYQLIETTIRKTRSKEEGLYDTSVSTGTRGDTVFLLRGAQNLRPGKIDTVFDSKSDENFGYFTDSLPKGFGLRGSFWKSRAENLNSNGSPTKGTSLVLERLGFGTQTLRYLPNGCDDCGWSVEWVGDLNGDGNLDFLIDLSGHYNSSEPTLFLSTEDGNKIVKVFAGFHVVGC